jgi:hypothetical protein
MNIYYKIYKLYQRNIPIQQISVTTRLPVKTIRDLIARFESKGVVKEEDVEKIFEPFLDYAITKFRRYVIVDFYGMLREGFSDKIKAGLEEAKQLPGQILAIKLEGITEIDDVSMKIILDFKAMASQSMGRTVMLLSPNNIAEEYILTNNVEEKIKIFGTQNAFEEYIFKHSTGITTSIPRISR